MNDDTNEINEGNMEKTTTALNNNSNSKRVYEKRIRIKDLIRNTKIYQ